MEACEVVRLFVNKAIVSAEPKRRGNPGYGQLRALRVRLYYTLYCPFSIVAGIPARVLKCRFDKVVIDRLLEIKWWNWSRESIGLNRRFFDTDLRKITVKQLDELILL